MEEQIARQQRLLEVAKAEYEQCASQAAELEGKAKTYLTINALMMSVGVLALARGGIPDAISEGWRIGTGVLLMALLLVLGNSYRHLLEVLSVSTFRGVPRSSTTIHDYQGRPESELLKSLTDYFSNRATSNRNVVDGKVRSLRSAVLWSKIGFAVFLLLSLSLITTWFLPRSSSMTSDTRNLSAENTDLSPDGGGGSSEGGGGPGGSGGGSSDTPPPPLEETILEKGGKPDSTR